MDGSVGALTKKVGNSSLDFIYIIYIICWSLIKKRHFSHQNPEQPEQPVPPALVLDHSQGHTTAVAPRNKHGPEGKFLLWLSMDCTANILHLQRAVWTELQYFSTKSLHSSQALWTGNSLWEINVQIFFPLPSSQVLLVLAWLEHSTVCTYFCCWDVLIEVVCQTACFKGHPHIKNK